MKSIQVYDGDGDSRTEAERAHELIMETIRVAGEEARQKLIDQVKHGCSPAQMARIDISVKEITEKMAKELMIPYHMLKAQ